MKKCVWASLSRIFGRSKQIELSMWSHRRSLECETRNLKNIGNIEGATIFFLSSFLSAISIGRRAQFCRESLHASWRSKQNPRQIHLWPKIRSPVCSRKFLPQSDTKNIRVRIGRVAEAPVQSDLVSRLAHLRKIIYVGCLLHPEDSCSVFFSIRL